MKVISNFIHYFIVQWNYEERWKTELLYSPVAKFKVFHTWKIFKFDFLEDREMRKFSSFFFRLDVSHKESSLVLPHVAYKFD